MTRPSRTVMIGVLATLILAACGQSGGGRNAGGRSQTGTRPHPDRPSPGQTLTVDPRPAPDVPMPKTFVAAVGPHENVALLSSRTGAIIRVISRHGPDFTNNGLALSPDGRWVYTTWIAAPKLRIERSSIKGGPRTIVADGEQPAVSPDGRRLAYASGKQAQSISVRDLRSGRTRSWNLRSVMGPNADLMVGHIVWLGDGRLVAIPRERPVDVDARQDRKQQTGGCASDRDHMCLISLDPSAAHPAIRHDRIRLISVISVVSGRTNGVIVAAFQGERTLVERIELTAHGVRQYRVAEFTGMPQALDASGTWLLYLVGHSPPALWAARVSDGRLAHKHLVMARSRIMGGVVW